MKIVTVIAGVAALVALVAIGYPYLKDLAKQQAIASYPNEWVVKVANIKGDSSLKIEKSNTFKDEVVERWEDVTPDNLYLATISDGKKSLYFPAVNFGPSNKREIVIVTPMNQAFGNVVDQDEQGFVVSGFDHKKQRLLDTYSKLHKKLVV